MNKRILMFVVTVLALATIACCTDKRVTEEKITGVERIFMHERGFWSVLINEGDVSHRKEIFARTLRPFKEEYYRDVPDGETMWIFIRRNGDEEILEIDFHLHSENDIQGGGWNHGKFGHGQTSVVQ